MTNTYVAALAVSPNGDVYAGPGAGEFSARPDLGDHWNPVNSGLSQPFVLSLAANPNGDVFAGTDFGSGVFRLPNGSDTWTAIDDGLTRGTASTR